jgi:hypothetical protein
MIADGDAAASIVASSSVPLVRSRLHLMTLVDGLRQEYTRYMNGLLLNELQGRVADDGYVRAKRVKHSLFSM